MPKPAKDIKQFSASAELAAAEETAASEWLTFREQVASEIGSIPAEKLPELLPQILYWTMRLSETSPELFAQLHPKDELTWEQTLLSAAVETFASSQRGLRRLMISGRGLGGLAARDLISAQGLERSEDEILLLRKILSWSNLKLAVQREPKKEQPAPLPNPAPPPKRPALPPPAKRPPPVVRAQALTGRTLERVLRATLAMKLKQETDLLNQWFDLRAEIKSLQKALSNSENMNKPASKQKAAAAPAKRPPMPKPATRPPVDARLKAEGSKAKRK